jgi:hypothetical protein
VTSQNLVEKMESALNLRHTILHSNMRWYLSEQLVKVLRRIIKGAKGLKSVLRLTKNERVCKK